MKNNRDFRYLLNFTFHIYMFSNCIVIIEAFLFLIFLLQKGSHKFFSDDILSKHVFTWQSEAMA